MMNALRAVPVDLTKEHYAEFLAPIYRWMLGDFPTAIERSRAELGELGVGPARKGARALDLGAGLGLQTLPLVELGYEVTAVDSSDTLLAELSAACPRARVVGADLSSVSEFAVGKYDVVVCMGDTITHFRSANEVRVVLRAASEHVAPGGLFLLTFRDYTGRPAPMSDRFILVRGDAERILTCHLDYSTDRVLVTDILHELSAGFWSVRASKYEKLRLSPLFIAQELAVRDLFVERCESVGGRVTIAARRGPIPG